MSIIQRVHDLIQIRDISKLQLARDAGIDFEVLDDSLKSNVPFKGAVVLGKLAKFFHVSIHWLITGESENKETERRLNDLLDENLKLRKEVKELKGFVASLAPCNYDEYLGQK